jgi:hypothetical protein
MATSFFAPLSALAQSLAASAVCTAPSSVCSLPFGVCARIALPGSGWIASCASPPARNRPGRGSVPSAGCLREADGAFGISGEETRKEPFGDR